MSHLSRARHGTDGVVPVYPREVAKRRLAPSASAVNFVRNHLLGDPDQNSAEIAIINEAAAAASKAWD